MNRAPKLGFAPVVVGTVAFVSFVIVSQSVKLLKDYARESRNFRAELDAQRKADEAVRDLIQRGHYDNMPDRDARNKAMADDYAFFKMAAKLED